MLKIYVFNFYADCKSRRCLIALSAAIQVPEYYERSITESSTLLLMSP